MMPAPGALAIVVKRLLAMMAAMETVSVPIDDHTVVIVVVPIMAVVMSLGLDDDAFFCGRDRRRSQAKRQCAKDDGLHFEFSKNETPFGKETLLNDFGSGIDRDVPMSTARKLAAIRRRLSICRRRAGRNLSDLLAESLGGNRRLDPISRTPILELRSISATSAAICASWPRGYAGILTGRIAFAMDIMAMNIAAKISRPSKTASAAYFRSALKLPRPTSEFVAAENAYRKESDARRSPSGRLEALKIEANIDNPSRAKIPTPGIDSFKDQTGGGRYCEKIGVTSAQPAVTTAGPNSRTCAVSTASPAN